MDTLAPRPAVLASGPDCLVAYRISRRDHCAVLRFRGVRSVGLRYPDEGGTTAGGAEPPRGWAVDDDALAGPGFRRWIGTFPGETLEITARSADVVARAIEASDPRAALAMVTS